MNFPVRIKQVDLEQLSGFITGVSKSGVFDVFLQDYIDNSGYFGSHIVYTTGNQDISGYKIFTSGAFGPLATGTGQYVPLIQLTDLSGFVGSGFYPLNTNPSGYVTGIGVQAITVTGSDIITGTIDFSGTSGVHIFYMGQTVFFSGDGITAVQVTGAADIDHIKGILSLESVSGIVLIQSGNTITISGQTGDFYPLVGNPSGFLDSAITGIIVSGNYNNLFPTINLLTGEVEFKGVQGIRTFLSGSTIFISGKTTELVFKSETGAAFYPRASNPSGYLTAATVGGSAVTGIVVDGVAFFGEVFLTGVSGVTVYNDGQTIYASGNTGDFFPRYETGNFYASDNPSGFLTLSNLPAVTGIKIDGSGAITGQVTFTGISGVGVSLSGQTVVISGITGDFYPLVGNPSGFLTTGTNSYVTGVKARFYGVFGSPSSNGDYNVVAGGTNGTTRLNFYCPSEFTALVSLQAIGICSAGAAQTARNIDLTSDFAAIGESRTANSQSNTTITYDLSAASNIMTGLDVSSVFSGMAAEDYCGLLLTHNTIGGNFDYLGILLKYT